MLQIKGLEKRILVVLLILSLLLSTATLATAGAGIDMAGSRINIMEITARAPGTVLTLDRETTVGTLIVNAPAIITGPGTVKVAFVNINGVSFDLAPAVALKLAEGVTVIIGGKEISSPNSIEPSSSSSGGGERNEALPIPSEEPAEPEEPEEPAEPVGPKTYSLTLSGAGLTADIQADEADEIEEDTKITVTVAAPRGKQVETFTVNGKDCKAELIGGEYVFILTSDTTVEVTYEDIPAAGPVSAGFVLTGNIGLAPESAGAAAGKIYAEYRLVANEEEISLARDNVEYIKVKAGEESWKDLTANTDATLWFNVEKEAGRYEFKIKTTVGMEYCAILDWQEEIGDMELAATVSEETKLGTNDTYVKLEIKEDGDESPSLDENNIELVAQKAGGKWVKLEPGTDDILWFYDAFLWFKKDKGTGLYEFFFVTDENKMFKATLDWTSPGEIKQLAAGNDHSLALKNDGTVWAWGCNTSGQLGDGTRSGKLIPVQVNNLTDVKAIAAGEAHSLALKNDNLLYAWGSNNNDQFGNGTSSSSSTPKLIKEFVDAKTIVSGSHHSLLLKNNGTVYAWGSNIYGQLGDGTNKRRTLPVQVNDLTDVKAIAAGSSHSLVLKDGGTVWSWGRNDSGQLGNETTTDSNIPVQVKGLEKVQAIAAGYFHSFAIKDDGTVWAWGYNSDGQLGDDSIIENSSVPVQVSNLAAIKVAAAGDSHSLAIKNNGTVWAWGRNKEGQLGDGSMTDGIVPVQVDAQGNYLTIVEAVAAGSYHSLALANGSVFAWGLNSKGQLGDGTVDNKAIPVQILFK